MNCLNVQCFCQTKRRRPQQRQKGSHATFRALGPTGRSEHASSWPGRGSQRSLRKDEHQCTAICSQHTCSAVCARRISVWLYGWYVGINDVVMVVIVTLFYELKGGDAVKVGMENIHILFLVLFFGMTAKTALSILESTCAVIAQHVVFFMKSLRICMLWLYCTTCGLPRETFYVFVFIFHVVYCSHPIGHHQMHHMYGQPPPGMHAMHQHMPPPREFWLACKMVGINWNTCSLEHAMCGPGVKIKLLAQNLMCCY